MRQLNLFAAPADLGLSITTGLAALRRLRTAMTLTDDPAQERALLMTYRLELGQLAKTPGCEMGE